MRTAIVILNWNGKDYLQKFLPLVIAHSGETASVIVADNASTDDSVNWLQLTWPQVGIIRLQENYGFAKGYNEALKQVEAEYFVLLNSDVEVTAGWIEPVIALMDGDVKIAACQPKILMESNRHLFEYAGGCGGWIDGLGYPFARGRIFMDCEEDHGQYDDSRAVFWASGCAFFVRAAAYRACGGLDEFFFAHMEEIDLCWRLQLNGYRVMACPLSVVYHVGGGTLPNGSPRKIFLNFRNNLVMLYKNLPPGALWWKLPLRMMLDIVSAIRALVSGEPRYFAAVLRSHVAFAGWFFSGQRRRDWRKAGPLDGWYRGSIVWDYFVRGRRKFSQIRL